MLNQALLVRAEEAVRHYKQAQGLALGGPGLGVTPEPPEKLHSPAQEAPPVPERPWRTMNRTAPMGGPSRPDPYAPPPEKLPMPQQAAGPAVQSSLTGAVDPLSMVTGAISGIPGQIIGRQFQNWMQGR